MEGGFLLHIVVKPLAYLCNLLGLLCSTVRLYAKFLEHVKHDPWSAAKWFA
jgi:hypothetical protein